MMKFPLLGGVLLCVCMALLHCGPIQNVCSPGTQGTCTCPDGSNGSRICGDNQRMGPCFCKRPPSETTGEVGSDSVAETPTGGDGGVEPTVDAADSAGPADEPGTQPEPTSDGVTPEPTSDESTAADAPSDAGDEPAVPDTPPADNPTVPECSGGPDACNASCSPTCSGGSQCRNGQCICPSGLNMCSGFCADLEYDPLHCGSCGKTCSADQACFKRKCQCFFSRLIKDINVGCTHLRSVAYSLDGKMLAAINDNGNKCGSDAFIWDAATRKEIHVFKGVTYRPVQILIFKDNDTIMVRGGGRRFYRMSLKTKAGISYIDAPGSGTRCAAIDPRPGNKLFAVGISDKSFATMDNSTRKATKHIKGLPGVPTAIAYRGDGKFLALALDNKEVRIYDTTSWQVTKSVTGLSDKPTSVAFNKAGDLLAIGQLDSTIALWNPNTGKMLRKITFAGTFVYKVYHVRFSADGKYVFSAWADRAAKVHEVATGRLLHTIDQHRNEVRAFTVSPDGKMLVTGAGTHVRLWGCP